MLGWSLTEPIWLWAIPVLVIVLLAVQRGSQRLPPWRMRAGFSLRLIITLLLVAALGGLQLHVPSRIQQAIFVRDRSDSLNSMQQAAADQFVQAALAAAPASASAAVIGFAAEALVDVAPAPAGDVAARMAAVTRAPAGNASDIAAALQLALAVTAPDVQPRIVLLSDGRDTGGSAALVAAEAAVRGIPIDVVASEAGGSDDAAISALQAPATAAVGKRVTIEVSLVSTTRQAATLTLIDPRGLNVSRVLTLEPGVQQQRFTVILDQVGLQRYRLQLTAARDRRTENNVASLLIQVAGAPRVLLLAAQREQGEALQAALTAAGIAAELRNAADAPVDLAGMTSYAAIVLINTPAALLPTGLMEQLPTYVRDLGNGLLMVGGTESYALGGYTGTAAEQALPVTMDVRTRIAREPVALVYLIDSSGSMDTCHCNADNSTGAVTRSRKLDLARDAAAQSAALLGSDDQASVITFDDTALVRLGLRRNISAADVLAALEPAQPRGATSLRAGLLQAERTLADAAVERRHIIVVSDGWNSDGDPTELGVRLRAAGISLSVVAVGSGAAGSLRQLAESGGGRFYAVEDISTMNAVFVQETITTFGSGTVEAPTQPQRVSAADLGVAADAVLPMLSGYNGATARDNARILLADEDGEPLLVTQQYGLGRSTAWLSDLHGGWSRAWLDWALFPDFAAALVEGVIPPAGSGRADITVDVRSDRALIDVSGGSLRDGLDVSAGLIDDRGNVSWVALQSAGPAAYRGELLNPEPGSYIVTIAATQSGRLLAQETSGLVIPYAAEYRLLPEIADQNATIAALSGGRQVQEPAQIWQERGGSAYRSIDATAACLLLATLLWPVDIALRRLILPSRYRQRLDDGMRRLRTAIKQLFSRGHS